jgi:hypothetical protein
MGTKDPNELELYYRSSVFNSLFEFHCVVFNSIQESKELSHVWERYNAAYFIKGARVEINDKEKPEDVDDEKLHRLVKSPERKLENFRSYFNVLT